MINEVIGSILNAETKAEQIVAEANLKAKEIISQADAQILEIAQNNADKIKKDCQEVILEGEKQAQQKFDEIIAAGKAQAQKLKKDATERVNDVVGKVVGRLV